MATAILLETDHLDDSLAGRASAPGLLPAAGRPLVDFAARALGACGDVDRVVLVGPTCYAQNAVALSHVDETLLLDEPLKALANTALDRYADCDELLLWRPNAPLLTPDMVESFLAHAPAEAAMTVAMVRYDRAVASLVDAPLPAAIPLGPERLLFTSLVIVRPAALTTQRSLVLRLLSDGIIHSELARVLGVGFAIKLTSGRARLDELARRMSELVQAPCVLQLAPQAELAVRVRTRAEYNWVRERLEVG